MTTPSPATPPPGRPTITVSAVVVLDPRGRLLTVRKRGTRLFMFPGGKPEPGESPEATAVREAAEELGVHLDPARLVPVGTVRTEAANEAGHALTAHVLEHPWTAGLAATTACAEIEETRWTDTSLGSPLPDDLAPLTREVITLLRARA